MIRVRILMCLMVLAVAAAMAGCDVKFSSKNHISRVDSGTLDVMHDDVRNVTCWQSAGAYGVGLSCIPDWQLLPGAAPALSIPEQFQLRSDALSCAEGRLPEDSTECQSWRERSRQQLPTLRKPL